MPFACFSIATTILPLAFIYLLPKSSVAWLQNAPTLLIASVPREGRGEMEGEQGECQWGSGQEGVFAAATWTWPRRTSWYHISRFWQDRWRRRGSGKMDRWFDCTVRLTPIYHLPFPFPLRDSALGGVGCRRRSGSTGGVLFLGPIHEEEEAAANR